MSPIRSDIEQVMSVRASNLALWDKAAEAFPSWDLGDDLRFEANEESFPHSSAAARRRPMMYDTIEQDTPVLPAHVIDLGLEPTDAAWLRVVAASVEKAAEQIGGSDAEARLRALSERLAFAPGSGRLRLYYARIMIVEFELAFDDQDAVCSEQELSDLEALGLVMANQICVLADEVVTAKLAPAIIALSAPGASIMRLRTAEERTEHRKFLRSERGPVLWVTRTLILADVAPGSPAEETAAAWLGAVSRTDWRAALEEAGHCIEWLRYAVDEAALARNDLDFEDVWEGLLFSQFFYALIERLEFEIFDLLGELKWMNGKPVHGAYQTLTRAREEAQLALVHHNHLKRFLARKRFEVANKILDSWGFEGVAANLEEAISVCDARVRHWVRRSAARNAIYTDILLFAIGSVAIIAFIVDLTIIGRTLSSDAALGLRNEGVLDMAGGLSRLPLDAVLTGGVVLIVALAWWLYRLRRRDML
ncbi:MAG: hypothetical protein PVI23_12640 [Maricaulaceae bacterium]